MTNIGRYEVAGVIGSGGFGTVYLCTDPTHGELVAAKVLDRGSVDDPDFLARVHHEAAAMRQVDDEHSVRVREVIVERDLAAIVTDFVDGASLRAVLDRYERLSGPQAVDVLRGALHGLAAVHRAGLLHGDVKPENVLIGKNGVSRLIDFGLAAAPPAVGVVDGGITGSPAYLSPEQIRGETADVRSDIYACAVMLFELLCGRRPYGGADAAAVLAAHLSAPVPDPRAADASIGEEFARLCMAGLAKDPAARPQSADEFLRLLEDAARDRYGTAWRTGLGLGALVGGLAAAAGSAKAMGPAPGAAGSAVRAAAPATRRLGSRAFWWGGAAVVTAAAVVGAVLATRPGAHNAAAVPSPRVSTTRAGSAGPLVGRLFVTVAARPGQGGAPAYDLLDTSGALRTTVTQCAQECGILALSPDGRQILAQVEGALVAEHADGTHPTVLWGPGTGGEGVGAASWSPDGTRVAFSICTSSAIGPTHCDIDVTGADATAPPQVVAQGDNVHSLAWSADESQLAFVQNQGGIWLVTSSGGPARNVLADPAVAGVLLPGSLSWAPSQSLLFDELGAAPAGVWRVASDGSEPRSVLAGATSPTWSPDGGHFAAV
ncbi:MAG: eukaryotic-like serine/threonine-protein kinase, partial [Pseudonocardiales bacterium]|nr:eukaryotic-like serine/threonine-protein kinase [Pseudonocardiales bacterium]